MGKIAKNELLVGLFLLMGIILVGGGIFLLGGLKSDSKSQYPLRIVYKDAGGLIKKSDIKMGGAKVGTVSADPQLSGSGSNVVVTVNINENIKIQRGAAFKIEMQNFLGDKYIDIVPPDIMTEDYYKPNELIFGDSSSDLTKFRENAVSVSKNLANLLSKLDENSDGLVKTINEISLATQELSEASRRINNSLLSDKNLENVEKILAYWEKGSSEFPEMMEEAKLTVSEVRSSAEEAKKIMSGANERLARVDSVLDQIEPAVRSLRVTSDGMAQVTNDLNKGRGTVGLLLKNDRFKKDVETFIRNLRDYGILRYRNPNEPEPLTDPRAGYSGSRR